MCIKKRMKWASIFAAICMVVFLFAACGGNEAPADNGSAVTPVTPPPAGSGSAPADSGSAAPSIDPIEFTIAHPHPAGSDADTTYQNIKKFADEYSGGAMQIEVFPAGSLVNSNEMFQSVSDGTVDIGHVVNADVSTAIPATALLDVPGVIRPGLEEITALIPVLQPMFEANGFYALGPTPLGPLDILCDTKQVKTPADLQGMTVRATGKYVGEAVQNWGGSPASIPLTDLPTALERHTVDAVLLDELAVQMFKMYENQEYVTKTNLQGAVSFVLINLDSWNSMSPEQQEILQRATDEATLASGGSTNALIELLNEEMTANENTVYELTDEERQVFLDAAKPALDSAIAAGGEDAQTLYEAIQNLQQ